MYESHIGLVMVAKSREISINQLSRASLRLDMLEMAHFCQEPNI